jgi:hypothetical protein
VRFPPEVDVTPVREAAGDAARRVLPDRLVQFRRHRRALRRYLRALAADLYDRPGARALAALEDRVLDDNPRFYDAIMHALMVRSDVILEGLGRRIAAVEARHAVRLRDLQRQIDELRAERPRADASQAERSHRDRRPDERPRAVSLYR